MSNGLFPPTRNSIKAISFRVAQLKTELSLLEKIVKKMLEGKKLTGDEKDTIDLLETIRSDSGRGWAKWNRLALTYTPGT